MKVLTAFTGLAGLAGFVGLVGFLACPGAAAAGPVDVKMVQPERFADVGWRLADRERNLELIRQHFESLGARLPAGQALAVEILDIDLAGEELPGPHPAERWRVLTGRADWPRMRLRYTLSVPGQPARSMEEWLADLAYLQRVPRAGDHPLPYEARMIDEWFAQRILQGEPAR